MTTGQALWAGIAPKHVPALVGVVLLAVLAGLWRALDRDAAAGPARTVAERWATVLLVVAAAVHLALPLGHTPGPVLTIGFLASGAAYGWLAMRVRPGRRWRTTAALLVVATLVGYVSVVTTGGEEADQVGLATALVELMILGLALVPVREPGRPRRLARAAGSAATATAVVLVGVVVWVAAFVAHDTAPPATAATAAASTDHDHGHGHASRSQAGVVMRPTGADHHPTASQVAAATALATATTNATAPYADLDAALAAGYRATGRLSGVDVHLERRAYLADGRTLDPTRPETLVYAAGHGRALLLGAVFQMEVAGRAAPEPGGPLTRWHAHNVCVSALPPGFGVASPYGGCPPLTLAFTTVEMMHVWTVPNPRGPFAEGLDETWVRGELARAGRPFSA